MELKEQVYSVLIVSAADKFNRTLFELLPEMRYQPITAVKDVASARRALLERSFDIVLINSPLPDEFGTRLATDICQDSGAGVLIFVKAEHFSEINSRLMQYGVLTLSKPTSGQMVTQSLTLLCGTRERLRGMEKKTASLEDKMEEIRLVNRAKWLIIDVLKMSENEAHRFIEKQAMDRCVTRKVIAEEIIAAYT